MGLLAVDEGTPYISRAHFEEALMHYPDHPSAIVGLSNILLDVYSEVLLPPLAIPSITGELGPGETANSTMKARKTTPGKAEASRFPPATPLGLGGDVSPDVWYLILRKRGFLPNKRQSLQLQTNFLLPIRQTHYRSLIG